MNLLFFTMTNFTSIEMHNIYSDLMKVFIENGHVPYIVTPRERKTGEKTELLDYGSYKILKVVIGNTSNVSLIEKGVSTVLLSTQYYKAIIKYLGHVNFDLILYSTPPITIVSPIKKLKKRYKCKTYLMLKDIFPQNAVDLEMFKKNSLLYRYFRNKEKRLYSLSDYIGCMSNANVEYLLNNNPYILKESVEICPNGIIPKNVNDKLDAKRIVREKYNIPNDAVIYLYGGNLGKPQNIPFVIKCLKYNSVQKDRYFIICGNGSDYYLLEQYINEYKPQNIKIINFLPKNEYDELVAGCDVGLVFLDNRFTIPNYPSRILSYMENYMPVIVCADKSTDVGLDAERNGYGMCCYSDDAVSFTECVNQMNKKNIVYMGKKARLYLEKNFTADACYMAIMSNL